MNVFICPKCKGKLTRSGGSLNCENGHGFDIASSGYVNLLLSEQMNAKLPGDNKLMVNARRDFLNKGYYSVLLKSLCETVMKYIKPDNVIFDAGCGEGYYTYGMAEHIRSSGTSATIAGADISKLAVNAAAKRFRQGGFDNVFLSVASVFRLPVKSGSCNILTTLFAPFCREEYLRVLCGGGIMIMVIPSERHLFGLKSAVYETPYLNEVKDFFVEGFKLTEHIPVRSEITLSCKEDILNLFSMTPYYYKTGREEQARLSALDTLTTEIGFEILVYTKE